MHIREAQLKAQYIASVTRDKALVRQFTCISSFDLYSNHFAVGLRLREVSEGLQVPQLGDQLSGAGVSDSVDLVVSNCLSRVRDMIIRVFYPQELMVQEAEKADAKILSGRCKKGYGDLEEGELISR